MLKSESLSVRHGTHLLFEGLDFVVHAGQKCAIAGRNGVGKSTLFRVILGDMTPDQGDLSFPQDWRISHMLQETDESSRSALDYVIDGDVELRKVEAQIAEAEQAGNAQDAGDAAAQLATLHMRLEDLQGYDAQARAAEILHGLGFSQEELHKPYHQFSGGWRIRINLARALMCPSDLLLLDEPTNHLDLEAIFWLEGWLKKFQGTVLLIAHDRQFLDNCCDVTVYLTAKSGRLYSGNYSSCERQRAEHAAAQQSAEARRMAKSQHMQQFIDRFRAKASKAKQVQSRIKALEKLQSSPVMQLESPYAVSFQNPDRVSNPLMSISQASCGYNQTAVLTNVGQTILPGARIGVVGTNGAGKSTLLKTITGDLELTGGHIQRGNHCEIGYFAQHQLETLTSEMTPLATTQQQHSEWTDQQCRDYLGRWGFSANMVERPINTLSGGEKARYVLAQLAAEKPALLVLDEPTNHLDLDMRDALIQAMQDYEGAVIIVSHDRNTLAQAIDEFWLVEDGGVVRFEGDVDDYLALRRDANVRDANAKTRPDATETTNADSSKKAQRQARAAARQAQSDLRKRVKQAEKQMRELEEKLKHVETQLADPQAYQTLPADELDDLLAKAGRYRSRLEKAEEDWLLASEALEQQAD